MAFGLDIAKIIKYEGPNNVLVWKHPAEDFNTSSQLIVHESQEAILFKDGQALDLFKAGRHTLTTRISLCFAESSASRRAGRRRFTVKYIL